MSIEEDFKHVLALCSSDGLLEGTSDRRICGTEKATRLLNQRLRDPSFSRLSGPTSCFLTSLFRTVYRVSYSEGGGTNESTGTE